MDLLKQLMEDSIPRPTDVDADSTPDPATLAKAATTPATVASVGRAFRLHVDHCLALVWIRRLSLAAAVLVGAQIVAAWVLMSYGRVILREEISRASRQTAYPGQSWGVSSAHAADQSAMPEPRK
jgi:hypothetical protein